MSLAAAGPRLLLSAQANTVIEFGNYAKFLYSEYGSKIKKWVTLNEAWTFTFLASGYGKVTAHAAAPRLSLLLQCQCPPAFSKCSPMPTNPRTHRPPVCSRT